MNILTLKSDTFDSFLLKLLICNLSIKDKFGLKPS